MKTKQLVYLAPNALRKTGHDEVYLHCVKSACKNANLEFCAFLPEETELKITPSLHKYFPLTKKYHFFSYTKLFNRFSQKNAVFFIEHISIKDLCHIVFATILSWKKASIFLLMRRDYSTSALKEFFLVNLLKLLQVSSKLTLLTDSSLIFHYFQEKKLPPKTVMPIPHIPQVAPQITPRTKIRAWWPGPPREAKGKQLIESLAKKLPNDHFELLLSEECGIENATHLPKHLPRKKYEETLASIDAVLLPYDPVVYRSGTSGILVEAVCAGKMPFVRSGSWLAFEVESNNLSELILDWNSDSIIDEIIQKINSNEIQSKLQKMKDVYQSFHTRENFNQILQSSFAR